MNLDHCHSDKVEGLEEFVNLRELSITNSGLESLTDFPRLIHLRELDLSGNKLKNGLDHLILPELEKLVLNDNHFSSMDAFKPLKQCHQLKELSVKGCPIVKTSDYRSKLFEMLESVSVIDNFDRSGNDVGYSSGDKSDMESDFDNLLTKEYPEEDEDDPTFEGDALEVPDDDEDESFDSDDVTLEENLDEAENQDVSPCGKRTASKSSGESCQKRCRK